MSCTESCAQVWEAPCRRCRHRNGWWCLILVELPSKVPHSRMFGCHGVLCNPEMHRGTISTMTELQFGASPPGFAQCGRSREALANCQPTRTLTGMLQASECRDKCTGQLLSLGCWILKMQVSYGAHTEFLPQHQTMGHAQRPFRGMECLAGARGCANKRSIVPARWHA